MSHHKTFISLLLVLLVASIILVAEAAPVTTAYVAKSVNVCLTSALEQKSQDVRNEIFEECINKQIRDENVSTCRVRQYYIRNLHFSSPFRNITK